MENINIDTIEITSIQDFEKMYDVWKTLENGNDMTIYQSYEWNRLLFEEKKKSAFNDLFSSVVIFQISLDGTVVGLLPIIIQKHSNKTKWFGRNKGLYILGHNSYSDYLNVVYAERINKICFDKLIEYLRSSYRGFTFYATDIRKHTKFCRFLNESGTELDKSDIAVQVEKMPTAEEYEKSLSKHVRQNLRTAKNRMDKAGIEYELRIFGMIDDDILLNQLKKIHIGRMAEKNMVTTDFVHKISSYIRIKYRQRQEHKNNVIAESMMRMEQSCLVIVYLKGDIAGYLYGLRDGSIIRIMQNCVKDKYKFYSPLFKGAYDFILEQYKDERIKAVDFTRGNEQYKYNLGGIEVNLESRHIAL